MPIETRSGTLSNQIGQLEQTPDYFTGDGGTTQFNLTYEVYCPANSPAGNSNKYAEIEVFDNGTKLEKYGTYAEYTVTPVGSVYNQITFATAPVSGHIISVKYRIINPK